jgi:hypothetical protein
MERFIQAPAVVRSTDDDDLTREPWHGSAFGIELLDFSFGASSARTMLAMRFQVNPEFCAPFAESLSELIFCAFSFEGIEGVRVSRVPGDDWLIKWYFGCSSIRLQFAASQAYRRHVRSLREFIAYT